MLVHLSINYINYWFALHNLKFQIQNTPDTTISLVLELDLHFIGENKLYLL